MHVDIKCWDFLTLEGTFITPTFCVWVMKVPSVSLISPYFMVFFRFCHFLSLFVTFSTIIWIALQGVSFRNWIFKLALRDRRTNIFFDLCCLVASGSADICVSSTSFQINDNGWPQQQSAKIPYDISWFYPKKLFFK